MISAPGSCPPPLLAEQPFSSAKVTLTWNMIDICRGVFMASRREKRKREREREKREKPLEIHTETQHPCMEINFMQNQK